MQMVLMGSGDEEYVGLLRALEDAYPGRVVAYVGYNTELEHKVRVGATSEPRWRAHGVLMPHWPMAVLMPHWPMAVLMPLAIGCITCRNMKCRKGGAHPMPRGHDLVSGMT